MVFGGRHRCVGKVNASLGGAPAAGAGQGASSRKKGVLELYVQETQIPRGQGQSSPAWEWPVQDTQHSEQAWG